MQWKRQKQFRGKYVMIGGAHFDIWASNTRNHNTKNKRQQNKRWDYILKVKSREALYGPVASATDKTKSLRKLDSLVSRESVKEERGWENPNFTKLERGVWVHERIREMFKWRLRDKTIILKWKIKDDNKKWCYSPRWL